MGFAALAIVNFVLQGLSSKEFARRFPTSIRGTALYEAIAMTVTALICAALGGAQRPTAVMLVTAIPFGVLFIATMLLYLTAMALGPMSMTTLLVNMSMVVPVTFGLLVWREQMTLAKALGVACVLGVLALSAVGSRSNSGEQKGGTRWLVVTLLNFLFNGGLSVLQKQSTLMAPEASVMVFNFWAFAVSALTGWLAVLFFKLRGADFAPWTGRKKELLLTSVGLGAGTAGGNIFQMVAMAFVPVIVLCPLVQGATVMALWVAAVTIYKEKATRAGIAMVALGLTGIVLFSL